MSEPTPLRDASTRAASSTRRWLALDLFRFVAVVMMVQGHVFYEVVDETVRAARWYGYHGYVHGFTAPIFLFSSGIAFGITTLAKWEEHTSLGKAVYKRFERYAILIGIGYALHMSQLSLSWVLGLQGEGLMRVTRVDALQNIGMTLAICEALALITRRKPIFLGVIAVSLLVAVAVAPWVWAADMSAWPIPIAAWINASTRSIFPLVPWAGFVLAGVLVARFVQRRREYAPDGWLQLAIPLLAFGAFLIVAGDRLAHADFDPFPEHNFWKTSPWFFCIRLGVVFGLLGGLCILDQWLERRADRRLLREGEPGAPYRWGASAARRWRGGGPDGFAPSEDTRPRLRSGTAIQSPQRMKVLRFVQVVGQQTLVVYVAHLMVLYGTGITPGVNGSFHRELGLGGAILMVSTFFVAMGLLAWVWNWTKVNHLRAFDRVRYAITAILVAVILLT